MRFTGLLFSALFIAFMSFTIDRTETIKIDIAASEVTWKANKVTGSHEGTIDLQDGNFLFEEGILKGGNFTIDMTSISTTDLEGEYKGKLDGHLKSADFFAVEEFPTASIDIKNVFPRGKEGEYKIVADATIKGISKEIKFNSVIADGIATADITLDRTDFNVRYGSGSFFENLGDKTIYDEFDLTVKIVYSN